MNKRVKKQAKKCTIIQCNVCGKEIVAKNDLLNEDVFEATKEWGYFSNKDLEVHRFNICEACYDNMISQFKIPVIKSKKKEAL